MSEQERKATAEAQHRAAVDSFARHRYRDAIDLFREADRLVPSEAFSFNVARCYERLGDLSNALAAYREYLRRADHPSDQGTVAHKIARLEARLAATGVQQVSVSSTPSGASVAIDGTALGVSPWAGAVPPGSHTVELVLAGYVQVRRGFELAKDHALDLEFALAREPVPTVAAPTPPQAPTTTAIAATAAPEPMPGPRAVKTSRQQAGTTATTTLGWIAIGASGAALGTALVFEVLRHGAEKDAERDTTQIRFAHDLERMRSRQTLARVFAGVGAGLAASGGALLWIGAPHNEKTMSTGLALSCIPSRCEARVAGNF